MKVFLLHRQQDFDWEKPFPAQSTSLAQDLEMSTLVGAMAQNDKYLFEIVQRVIFQSLTKPDDILYRQDILKDCLQNPEITREIYAIPVNALMDKRKNWLGIFSNYPDGILSGAVSMMTLFTEYLKKIKQLADEHADKFTSDGFTRFFDMIKIELNAEYLATVDNHLRELRFRNGVLLSAEIGEGNEGKNYILCKPNDPGNWKKRVFKKRSPVYSFRIHPRDDHGFRAISEIRNHGINLIANALAQSADHIESFFNVLKAELAFYIGCLNLSDVLKQIEEPLCFPQVFPTQTLHHSFSELYDICLSLTRRAKTVGNTLNIDEKKLVVITGANQGGKSTFLRSIGLAQMMMQAGIFVPATEFSANICSNIFCHYKRKEDASMKSGKLDEELSRMSALVDLITPGSLVLFNESFAATNEREGSEIGRQITLALVERGVKIFYVTHLYDLAHSLFLKQSPEFHFLRAERKAAGGRTYRLLEGEPLQTSHGQDLYRKVFEEP